MFQTTDQLVFSGQKDMGHPSHHMALTLICNKQSTLRGVSALFRGPQCPVSQSISAEYAAHLPVVNFEMSDVKNILNYDELWSSESMGILKIYKSRRGLMIMSFCLNMLNTNHVLTRLYRWSELAICGCLETIGYRQVAFLVQLMIQQ